MIFLWSSADSWQARLIATLRRSDNISVIGDGSSGSVVLLAPHIACCPSYNIPGLCLMHPRSILKLSKEKHAFIDIVSFYLFIYVYFFQGLWVWFLVKKKKIIIIKDFVPFFHKKYNIHKSYSIKWFIF